MAFAAQPTARVGVRASSSSSSKRRVVVQAATMQKRVRLVRAWRIRCALPGMRRGAAGPSTARISADLAAPRPSIPLLPSSRQAIGVEKYVDEVPVTLTRPDLDTPDT